LGLKRGKEKRGSREKRKLELKLQLEVAMKKGDDVLGHRSKEKSLRGLGG